jgi:ribosomal protein S13
MQRHQQIVEQVRAGSSLVAVAKAFGITHERVRQICERAGVRSVCRSYAESAEWRAERNLTIIERVKAGASLVAVSRELGLSPSLVRLVCHQAGVKAQRQSRQLDEAMAQRDQQIVEQVRAGSSLLAAARAFGLSHVAVWHICERAGVRSQSRQGRPRSRA